MTRRISRETLAPRHTDEIFFRKVLGGNSMMLLSLRIILFTHPFRTPFLKLLLRSFISKERDYDSSSLLPALQGVQQFFAHRVSPPHLLGNAGSSFLVSVLTTFSTVARFVSKKRSLNRVQQVQRACMIIHSTLPG